LLAKRLGAKKTITQINKFSYFSLMSTIGIEQVVSPRLSAINSILQHIRRGKVLSAISIKGEEGEVMEALALPTSDIVSKPLKKDFLPQGGHGGRYYPHRRRLSSPPAKALSNRMTGSLSLPPARPSRVSRRYWPLSWSTFKCAGAIS
jgi:hypothetical protein